MRRLPTSISSAFSSAFLIIPFRRASDGTQNNNGKWMEGVEDDANGVVNSTKENKADASFSKLKAASRRTSSTPELLPKHLMRPGKDISAHPRKLDLLSFDEDDDGMLTGASVVDDAVATVQEHELLDDAYTYFPLLDLDGRPINAQDNTTQERAEQKYVPGRQLIPPGVTRYRLEVQYTGSDFDGWYKSTEKRRIMKENNQSQAVLQDDDTAMSPTVRSRAKTVLEDALAIALDVDSVSVEAAAIPEVGCTVRRLTCHVDVPDASMTLQPRTVIQRATMWLEKKQAPLAILSFMPCRNQQFHARHSATQRVYVYRILNRIAPPLFDAGLQWHVDRFLDVERMSRFAEKLQGTMDYGFFADAKMAHALRKQASASGVSPSSFASSASAAAAAEQPPPTQELNLPTVRTIEALRVVRQDDEVLIWFVGKSFLRQQIRNMVAVLKMAGQGLWNERELEQAIKRGFEPSRVKAAREKPAPAPVHGLTLWEVQYPDAHRHDKVDYVDSGPLPVDEFVVER